LLLADVLFRFGGTTIIDAPDDGTSQHIIDAFTRRQTVFDFTGASFDIKVGTITAFATAVAQEITNHINETGASHPATAIDYDPTALPIPANWSATAAAGEVQTAIDSLVADLGQTTGTTGADLVGYDNSVTPNPLPGAPATVHDAIETILDGNGGTVNLDAAIYDFAGNLDIAGDITAVAAVTASGQVTCNGELETNAFLVVNGNVNFAGASWIKADPAHNFSEATLALNEHSEQFVNAAAASTDDVALYFNATANTGGIIRGCAMVWEDNTADSFVAIEFTVPFTLTTSSSPNIDSDYVHEIGGSSGTVMQGGSPTSVSLSVVTSTNTVSFRVTHNSGPTTRNLLLQWTVLEANLNQ
jgi:hypothetical protein